MVERMRKGRAKANTRIEYQPIDGGALRQTTRSGLSTMLRASKRREAGIETMYNEAQRTSSARADELCKELKLQREFICHQQQVLGIVP